MFLLNFDFLSKRFSLKQILVACLILFPVSLVFLPYGNLNDKVQEGNLRMASSDFNILALDSYERAQKEWPWLTVNVPFTKKISEARAIRDKYKENHAAILLFIKDKTVQKDIDLLIDEIENISAVTNVKLVTQEEALRIYQERNKNDPVLLELIDQNILPASIEVFMSDWTLINKIKDLAQKYSFVQEVVAQSDWLKL